MGEGTHIEGGLELAELLDGGARPWAVVSTHHIAWSKARGHTTIRWQSQELLQHGMVWFEREAGSTPSSVVTGTSSSSNRPAAIAARAFSCEADASVSCSSL